MHPQWTAMIGDPTAIGWATVAAYFVTAALCWRAGRIAGRRGRRAGIWPMVTAALLALGVNKQLDLQTLVVSIGRHVAMQQGWYEDRRIVQLVFIAALAAAAIVVCVGAATFARAGAPSERRALVGIVLLSAFVVIRAASFHHIDRLLGIRLSGVRMSQILELGGIAMIALPARAAGRRRSDPAGVPVRGHGLRQGQSRQ